MKETIITIKSEGAKTVIFRSFVEQLFVRELKGTGAHKSYELFAYYKGVRIWSKRFAFKPNYLIDQFRAYEVEILEFFEQELTMQQAQDLFDLSK